MKHLVFFSGGAGSYATTKRVLESGVSPDDLHLLFTDTQIEDDDLYRFLIDSYESFYKIDLSDAKKLVKNLTKTYIDIDQRKEDLLEIQNIVTTSHPNIHWIRYEVDGVAISPWDVFYNDLFIGNSMVANCSKLLKQRMARDYVRETFEKEELIVYLGIDWNEEHRTKAPTKNWSRWASDVRFPMCDEPYLFKDDIIQIIADDGIEIPKAYKQGFSHNNCFHGDEKFITDIGLISFKEAFGKDVKVLGTGASFKEAKIEKFGKQEIVNLNLVKNGIKKTVRTTESHRWFVRKNRGKYIEVLTKDLNEGDVLQSMYIEPSNELDSCWKFESIEYTGVYEEVYCAVVPDGHAFTLEDNIFTGNCGGFCVRAGQGHFANLLKVNPELYDYHARKEQELMKHIQSVKETDEVYTILKQQRDGVRYNISLEDLRKQINEKNQFVDLFEMGGCGCFVTDDEEDDKELAEQETRDASIRKWKAKDLVIVRTKEDRKV